MALSQTSTKEIGKLLQTSQLRDRLDKASQVILPGDGDYDKTRQAWNLAFDQYPALIIVANTAGDIAEAVHFAQAYGLKVAVQATGHGIIREADNSLLLVTSQMTDVYVNASAQTAWISAGTKWEVVLAETQAAGLAPLLGSAPDVGAIGYTLGGGMGWLARKYGLSSDSVNYFDVVTADGQLIRASAGQNTDLFWGLRGGGGGFGVVTGMEIRLYPISTVYAGNLFYPISRAREVYSRYRDWIENAPEELTSSILIMNFPPFPGVPEPLRGQSFVIVRGCYCGPLAQGEELLQHWRAWQTPGIDDFKAIPFSQAAAISSDPTRPTAGLSSGAWLSDLSDETVDTLIRYAVPENRQPVFMFAEVRHAGGAITAVDPASSAYGNRDALYNLQVVAPTPTPESSVGAAQYVAQFKQDLGSHLGGGVFLNFLKGDEAHARTRQGFSEQAYGRLQALKAKYDPDNLFSHSYDIPPATD